jgi:alpha-tubulin suppressor-like RCC1 family protein
VNDAVQLSASGRRTCAAHASGTVTCWGAAAREAARRPPAVGPRPRPEQVAGVHDVAEVAVGGDHVCARRRAGDVVCWGDNRLGQLGVDGEPAEPVAVPGVADVVLLAAGAAHTCALRRTGELTCWGRDRLEASARIARPRPIPGLADVTRVEAQADHTCALSASGRVLCWGLDDQGQIGVAGRGGWVARPTELTELGAVRDLALGRSHACALLETDGVTCWGSDALGRLGPAPAAATQTPLRVVEALADVSALAIGADHACAIRGGGEVVCWGSNSAGQLGRPAVRPPEIEGRFPDLSRIAAGGSLCVLRASGEVLCGSPGTSAPAAIGVGDAVDVSAGLTHACAVRRSGRVVCWGRHASEPGEPELVYGDGARPADVDGVDDVVSVAAGWRHTCTLRRDGHVWCWGRIPVGPDASSVSQRPVERAGLADAVQIAAGLDSSWAVRSDGSLVCWGGCGAVTSPTAGETVSTVAGIGDAARVAAASGACALHRSGRVSCLGLGASLPDEDPTIRAPDGAPIEARDGLAVGSTGTGFGCAVAVSGEVFCWGDNRKGQLGDGTHTPRARAVRVRGVAEASQVAAGEGFACAARGTGEIFCWGEGAGGASFDEHPSAVGGLP